MSQQGKISVQDAVEFIKKHDVLPKWTDKQISVEIVKALEEGFIAYTTDNDHKLSGFAFARAKSEHTVHVVALAGNKGILKVMLRHLKETWPGITHFSCFRKGQPRIYRVI